MAASEAPWQQWLESTKDGLKVWQAFTASLQAWAKEVDAKGAPDPFLALALIGDARSKGLSVQLTPGALERAEAWARAECSAQVSDFDRLLTAFCAEQKLQLIGRYPTYRIEGYLKVQLFVDKGQALVGVEKLSTISPARILKSIRDQLAEETSRRMPAPAVLSAIEKAYKRAILLKGASFGSSVPIRDLFRELVMVQQSEKFWKSPARQNLLEYDEEHLARDLSILLATSTLISAEGARLEFIPTAFPREGLKLYEGNGERIVGAIAFRQDLS